MNSRKAHRIDLVFLFHTFESIIFGSDFEDEADELLYIASLLQGFVFLRLSINM